MLLTAFGMCAIPYCRQAVLLTAFMSSIGISMGVLDTGKEEVDVHCVCGQSSDF